MNRVSKKINYSLISSYSLFYAYSVSAKIGEWRGNLMNSAYNSEAYNPNTSGTASELAVFIGKILWIGPVLGVVFIIHMVLAGYEWMTAAGDAKKVEDAKKRITNAVIGLVLFTGLYALAYFIIQSLTTVTQYGT